MFNIIKILGLSCIIGCIIIFSILLGSDLNKSLFEECATRYDVKLDNTIYLDCIIYGNLFESSLKCSDGTLIKRINNYELLNSYNLEKC